MEVILLRDIPKVGKKYDVKKVSDGYGMNYLLRQGFAEVATPQKISALATRREKSRASDKLQGELLKKAFAGLEGKVVQMSVKANEQEHLFRGVHRQDIVDAIEGEFSVRLEPDMIALEHPIKELGNYEIKIVSGDTKGKLTLSVLRAED
jgi:large subunit ribosomal protein L9